MVPRTPPPRFPLTLNVPPANVFNPRCSFSAMTLGPTVPHHTARRRIVWLVPLFHGIEAGKWLGPCMLARGIAGRAPPRPPSLASPSSPQLPLNACRVFRRPRQHTHAATWHELLLIFQARRHGLLPQGPDSRSPHPQFLHPKSKS
jgi:hypothetical protein